MAKENPLIEIKEKSLNEIKKFTKKEPLGVIGIKSAKEGWEALVEVVELEVTPSSQDRIGKYKLMFNKDRDLTSYKKIETRRRGETGPEEAGRKTKE